MKKGTTLRSLIEARREKIKKNQEEFREQSRDPRQPRKSKNLTP